ncbi:MAG: conjugal transfer protein TraF [Porticoccaceae bacterium]
MPALRSWLLSAPATAQTYPASKGPAPASGWHFYDDPEPEPEIELVEPQQPTGPKVETSDEKPELGGASSSGPAPMSAEWLKENMPRLLNQALDNPTRENLEAYYGAQRVMMDKAERFTLEAEKVVIGNPMLDAEYSSPVVDVRGACD